MLGALRRNGTRRARGLTMVEMMVVVAIAAVILTLTAPSMRDFLARQRVAAINAELVTDLQLARSEAIARNDEVCVTFRADHSELTCYTVHTLGIFGQCDCRKPIGTACLKSDGTAIPGAIEVKTVQVPRSTSVTLVPPVPGHSVSNQVIFTAVKGLVDWEGHRPGTTPADFANYAQTWADFPIGVESSRSGKLRTQVIMAGQPQVCSPDGSIRGVVECAP
jgi:prepilin-type N-terminal cleavage/methylation domain-containing protein